MYHSKMSGFCTDPFRRTVPGAFFHLPPHFLGTGPGGALRINTHGHPQAHIWNMETSGALRTNPSKSLQVSASVCECLQCTERDNKVPRQALAPPKNPFDGHIRYRPASGQLLPASAPSRARVSALARPVSTISLVCNCGTSRGVSGPPARDCLCADV